MKEFVVLTETPQDTQKKIRQWLSSGYHIEIVAQTAIMSNTNDIYVITSLYRTKLEKLPTQSDYEFGTTTINC